MSKGSGVPGKTKFQLARSIGAAKRAETCAARSPEEQLAALDGRPGDSRRERKRLAKLAGDC